MRNGSVCVVHPTHPLPTAKFVGYEWVMTDAYIPGNPSHESIKHDIAIGDGLPYISGAEDVRTALESAGFVVDEFRDLAPESQVPWYQAFAPSYTNLEGLRTTPIALALIHVLVTVLEAVGVAPKGTTLTHKHLIAASKGLYLGGQQSLFTPMLFFSATKPMGGKAVAAVAAPSPARGRSASPAAKAARRKTPARK